MRVITDNNINHSSIRGIYCVLTGGCQDEIIKNISQMEQDGAYVDHLHLVPSSEYQLLDSSCGIYSLYISSDDTVDHSAVIRDNLITMLHHYPLSYSERCVISIQNGYAYTDEVLEAIDGRCGVGLGLTPRQHAACLLMAYTWSAEDL